MFNNFKFYPVKNLNNTNGNSTLRANGRVTIASVIDVNFSIHEGKNGIFASFPSQKAIKDGNTVYYPYVKIADKDMYSEFQNTVKEEYLNFMSGNSENQCGVSPIGSGAHQGQPTTGEESQVPVVNTAKPRPEFKKDNIPF